jgi:hypothetical protein
MTFNAATPTTPRQTHLLQKIVLHLLWPQGLLGNVLKLKFLRANKEANKHERTTHHRAHGIQFFWGTLLKPELLWWNARVAKERQKKCTVRFLYAWNGAQESPHARAVLAVYAACLEIQTENVLRSFRTLCDQMNSKCGQPRRCFFQLILEDQEP